MTCVALLAIAAVTTVPARAQHQRYTAAVTLSDLQVGDTLAEGAMVTDCSSYTMVVNRYCESQNGTDYQLHQTNLQFPQQFDGPVGENGLLSAGNGIITFLPVHEDGDFGNGLYQTGDVWVVTNINGTTLSLAGATRAYTATLADGGIDADHWAISPAKAATTGVAAGTTVTLTYSGTREVKSVTAAPAPAPELINIEGITLDITDCTTWSDIIARNPGVIWVAGNVVVGNNGFLTINSNLIPPSSTYTPPSSNYRWMQP